MATQQYEAAKRLILHFTKKNSMSPESDIKGVMPGKWTTVGREESTGAQATLQGPPKA